MKFEEIHGLKVPKIGFGTWRIGGEAAPNPAIEEASLAALHSAVELGYTHFDTAEYYAGGHAEELLAQTMLDLRVKRESLFITSKVSPEHLRDKDVRKACENSLRRLKTEFIDLYLIHWPNPLIKLEETFQALNQLRREGKIRHIGVSNFKLRDLKKAVSLCESHLLTNQVPYSLPASEYVKNGVIEYCQQNEILITAYTPVKFRNLTVNKVIKDIADRHQATPFQIALAWLVAQPSVITIPMSFDALHQKQNLEAAEIDLSVEEMSLLGQLYIK